MKESRYWKNKWKNRAKKPPNLFAKRSYSLAKDKNFKTLLDLGSGDGRDSVYFLNKGYKVTAVDFSGSGIDKLKSLHNKNLAVFKKDIREINFPKNSFDIIYAHLSLHYFNYKETAEIFKEIFKLLKKGGCVFVKCKSVEDFLFGKGVKLGENIYRKGYTRHFFTKVYMRENLSDFKILKVRKTSSIYCGYKSSFIEAVATK